MKKYYFYPLIIFIFLVNYHFYGYYQGNFFQLKKLADQKKGLNSYEAIQSEHPYFEIWKISKNQQNKVFLVMDRLVDENFDYQTTYFKQLQGYKIKFYLSELRLMVNYFFYPRIIQTYTFRQLLDLKILFTKGDYIVSDFDFNSFYVTNYNNPQLPNRPKTKEEIEFDQQFLSLYRRLKTIEVVKKDLVMTNRHDASPYYIYEFIN